LHLFLFRIFGGYGERLFCLCVGEECCRVVTREVSKCEEHNRRQIFITESNQLTNPEFKTKSHLPGDACAKKLVKAIKGQVKSAAEGGCSKPDGQSNLEKLKYSGLSEDVTWRSKLESEVINRSLVILVPRATIVLTCGRDRELWPDPIF